MGWVASPMRVQGPATVRKGSLFCITMALDHVVFVIVNTLSQLTL